jgi:hypothetical protein
MSGKTGQGATRLCWALGKLHQDAHLGQLGKLAHHHTRVSQAACVGIELGGKPLGLLGGVRRADGGAWLLCQQRVSLRRLVIVTQPLRLPRNFLRSPSRLRLPRWGASASGIRMSAGRGRRSGRRGSRSGRRGGRGRRPRRSPQTCDLRRSQLRVVLHRCVEQGVLGSERGRGLGLVIRVRRRTPMDDDVAQVGQYVHLRLRLHVTPRQHVVNDLYNS